MGDRKRTRVIVAGTRDLIIMTEPNYRPVQWLDGLARWTHASARPRSGRPLMRLWRGWRSW